MTWFKVDDTLAAHPKTRKAGLPAMGLWTVAGSWSSQQLTEGFIPEWFVETWPRGKQYAANLVRAQLWFESDSGGERGYQFNDWTQCNPSAEQVKAERAAAAERQRRARERAAQTRSGGNRHGVTDAVTDAVTHDEVTEDVTRESPSESRSPRPDPTRPIEKTSSSQARKRAERISDSYTPSDTLIAWAGSEGFTPGQCATLTAEFIDYWRGIGGQRGAKLDWDGTWRNWVRKADPSRVREQTVLSVVGNMTKADCDRVLGPDMWRMPSPPSGMSGDEMWHWEQDVRAQHRAERVRLASAKLGISA